MSNQQNSNSESKREPIRNRAPQTIVSQTGRLPNSIQVGVDSALWVNNPIVKKTRSGHRYVQHEELAKHRFHPDCFCHSRTYLDRIYVECANCKLVHFILCDQTLYEEEDDICFVNHELCRSCLYSPFYREKFSKRGETKESGN